MIKTTYICDRCGSAQDKPEQMWEIVLRFREITLSLSAGSPIAKAVWCRKCCEAFPHLLWDKSSPIPETAPTIEDLLREVVRAEIEAAQP